MPEVAGVSEVFQGTNCDVQRAHVFVSDKFLTKDFQGISTKLPHLVSKQGRKRIVMLF